MDFSKLKEKLEEAQGTWNGDLPGVDEDRATTAQDALDLINQLEPLLESLNI